MPCVFLGKALIVPGACSPCSPLFSTLIIYLTTHNHTWPYMNIDHAWLYLTIWPYMIPNNHTWPYITSHDPTWPHMTIHDDITDPHISTEIHTKKIHPMQLKNYFKPVYNLGIHFNLNSFWLFENSFFFGPKLDTELPPSTPFGNIRWHLFGAIRGVSSPFTTILFLLWWTRLFGSICFNILDCVHIDICGFYAYPKPE